MTATSHTLKQPSCGHPVNEHSDPGMQCLTVRQAMLSNKTPTPCCSGGWSSNLLSGGHFCDEVGGCAGDVPRLAALQPSFHQLQPTHAPQRGVKSGQVQISRRKSHQAQQENSRRCKKKLIDVVGRSHLRHIQMLFLQQAVYIKYLHMLHVIVTKQVAGLHGRATHHQ